ncbi:hypothetical protein ZWY2020_038237 [Hordeum vulgare]|nr:hypothetical protein ZWY2020_038237 [Hordeum vulgare]
MRAGWAGPACGCRALRCAAAACDFLSSGSGSSSSTAWKEEQLRTVGERSSEEGVRVSLLASAPAPPPLWPSIARHRRCRAPQFLTDLTGRRRGSPWGRERK